MGNSGHISQSLLFLVEPFDRAFPVAGARVWNALPSSVTFVADPATIATFKRHSKTSLRGLFLESESS